MAFSPVQGHIPGRVEELRRSRAAALVVTALDAVACRQETDRSSACREAEGLQTIRHPEARRTSICWGQGERAHPRRVARNRGQARVDLAGARSGRATACWIQAGRRVAGRAGRTRQSGHRLAAQVDLTQGVRLGVSHIQAVPLQSYEGGGGGGGGRRQSMQWVRGRAS